MFAAQSSTFSIDSDGGASLFKIDDLADLGNHHPPPPLLPRHPSTIGGTHSSASDDFQIDDDDYEEEDSPSSALSAGGGDSSRTLSGREQQPPSRPLLPSESQATPSRRRGSSKGSKAVTPPSNGGASLLSSSPGAPERSRHSLPNTTSSLSRAVEEIFAVDSMAFGAERAQGRSGEGAASSRTFPNSMSHGLSLRESILQSGKGNDDRTFRGIALRVLTMVSVLRRWAYATYLSPLLQARSSAADLLQKLLAFLGLQAFATAQQLTTPPGASSPPGTEPRRNMTLVAEMSAWLLQHMLSNPSLVIHLLETETLVTLLGIVAHSCAVMSDSRQQPVSEFSGTHQLWRLSIALVELAMDADSHARLALALADPRCDLARLALSLPLSATRDKNPMVSLMCLLSRAVSFPRTTVVHCAEALSPILSTIHVLIDNESRSTFFKDETAQILDSLMDLAQRYANRVLLDDELAFHALRPRIMDAASCVACFLVDSVGFLQGDTGALPLEEGSGDSAPGASWWVTAASTAAGAIALATSCLESSSLPTSHSPTNLCGWLRLAKCLDTLVVGIHRRPSTTKGGGAYSRLDSLFGSEFLLLDTRSDRSSTPAPSHHGDDVTGGRSTTANSAESLFAAYGHLIRQLASVSTREAVEALQLAVQRSQAELTHMLLSSSHFAVGDDVKHAILGVFLAAVSFPPASGLEGLFGPASALRETVCAVITAPSSTHHSGRSVSHGVRFLWKIHTSDAWSGSGRRGPSSAVVVAPVGSSEPFACVQAMATLACSSRQSLSATERDASLQTAANLMRTIALKLATHKRQLDDSSSNTGGEVMVDESSKWFEFVYQVDRYGGKCVDLLLHILEDSSAAVDAVSVVAPLLAEIDHGTTSAKWVSGDGASGWTIKFNGVTTQRVSSIAGRIPISEARLAVLKLLWRWCLVDVEALDHEETQANLLNASGSGSPLDIGGSVPTKALQVVYQIAEHLAACGKLRMPYLSRFVTQCLAVMTTLGGDADLQLACARVLQTVISTKQLTKTPLQPQSIICQLLLLPMLNHTMSIPLLEVAVLALTKLAMADKQLFGVLEHDTGNAEKMFEASVAAIHSACSDLANDEGENEAAFIEAVGISFAEAALIEEMWQHVSLAKQQQQQPPTATHDELKTQLEHASLSILELQHKYDEELALHNATRESLQQSRREFELHARSQGSLDASKTMRADELATTLSSTAAAVASSQCVSGSGIGVVAVVQLDEAHQRTSLISEEASLRQDYVSHALAERLQQAQRQSAREHRERCIATDESVARFGVMAHESSDRLELTVTAAHQQKRRLQQQAEERHAGTSRCDEVSVHEALARVVAADLVERACSPMRGWEGTDVVNTVDIGNRAVGQETQIARSRSPDEDLKTANSAVQTGTAEMGDAPSQHRHKEDVIITSSKDDAALMALALLAAESRHEVVAAEGAAFADLVAERLVGPLEQTLVALQREYASTIAASRGAEPHSASPQSSEEHTLQWAWWVDRLTERVELERSCAEEWAACSTRRDAELRMAALRDSLEDRTMASRMLCAEGVRQWTDVVLVGAIPALHRDALSAADDLAQHARELLHLKLAELKRVASARQHEAAALKRGDAERDSLEQALQAAAQQRSEAAKELSEWKSRAQSLDSELVALKRESEDAVQSALQGSGLHQMYAKNVELLKSMHRAKLQDMQREVERATLLAQAAVEKQHEAEAALQKVIAGHKSQVEELQRQVVVQDQHALIASHTSESAVAALRTELTRALADLATEQRARREAEAEIQSVQKSHAAHVDALVAQHNKARDAAQRHFDEAFRRQQVAARREAAQRESQERDLLERQAKEGAARVAVLQGQLQQAQADLAALQASSRVDADALRSQVALLTRQLKSSEEKCVSSSEAAKRMKDELEAERKVSLSLCEEVQGAAMEHHLRQTQATAEIAGLKQSLEESQQLANRQLQKLVEDEQRLHLLTKRVLMLEAEDRLLQRTRGLSAFAAHHHRSTTPTTAAAAAAGGGTADEAASVSRAARQEAAELLAEYVDAQRHYYEAELLSKSTKIDQLKKLAARPSSFQGVRDLSRGKRSVVDGNSAGGGGRRVAWEDLSHDAHDDDRRPRETPPPTTDESAAEGRASDHHHGEGVKRRSPERTSSFLTGGARWKEPFAVPVIHRRQDLEYTADADPHLQDYFRRSHKSK